MAAHAAADGATLGAPIAPADTDTDGAPVAPALDATHQSAIRPAQQPTDRATDYSAHFSSLATTHVAPIQPA